jgi:methylated-DNA-[protein]-cysteine S-methyltransferase
MATETSWQTVMPSALGELTLVRDEQGLRGLYFPHHWYRPDSSTFGPRRDDGFDEVKQQLSEYLTGQRRQFELALRPVGNARQQQVWELIQRIPYGETATYGTLAAQIASEYGGVITAQETGAAVGRNPLSILIACHRVVGANGKLTGYAGGLGRKRHLLELERDQARRSARIPSQATLIPGFW